MKLSWTQRASDQLSDVAVYLEEARTGYGEVFLNEVEEAVWSGRRRPEGWRTD